jgi:hypothetical protein
MFALLLATLNALATTSFYHPNDIAAASTEFSRASATTSATFSERASQANAIAAALNNYEEALDMLGDRTAATERARQKELAHTFNREFAVLSAFASAMAEDFDQVFTEAMDRAMNTVAPQALECLAKVPATAHVLPGIDIPLEKNEKCVGQNINRAIAGLMDKDPALIAAIDEIAALEWPAITVELVEQAATGTGNGSIGIIRFFGQVYGRELNIIREHDEMARLPFQNALEEGASIDELKKLELTAIQLTQKTAQKRAALCSSVIEASELLMSKWGKKDFQPAGWCANPEILGGCTGDDRTKEMLKRLLDEPKFIKSVSQ